MMNNSLIAISLFLIFSLLGMAVSSAEQPKRTTINFEDQLIKGENQKPDLLTIFKRKNLNHKKLLNYRWDFLDRMRATANNIDEGTKPRLRSRSKKSRKKE